MTMLVINCRPCVECQYMLKSRGDHAHQILSCLHMRTESYGNLRAPRPSVKNS
jgi:hypothetical protein